MEFSLRVNVVGSVVEYVLRVDLTNVHGDLSFEMPLRLERAGIVISRKVHSSQIFREFARVISERRPLDIQKPSGSRFVITRTQLRVIPGHSLRLLSYNDVFEMTGTNREPIIALFLDVSSKLRRLPAKSSVYEINDDDVRTIKTVTGDDLVIEHSVSPVTVAFDPVHQKMQAILSMYMQHFRFLGSSRLNEIVDSGYNPDVIHDCITAVPPLYYWGLIDDHPEIFPPVD
jgi:hypothetical protein